MFRFEKLEIWKEANSYADEIYKITRDFPKEEVFSLVDQMRRSANSIAANIAEGSASSSVKDFKNYLLISIKSTYENASHLQRAMSLGYIAEIERKRLYDKAEVLVRRMRAFQKSLRPIA